MCSTKRWVLQFKLEPEPHITHCYKMSKDKSMNDANMIFSEIQKIRKKAVVNKVDGIDVIQGGWRDSSRVCTEWFHILEPKNVILIRATNSFDDSLAIWLLKTTIHLWNKKHIRSKKLTVTNSIYGGGVESANREFDSIGYAPPGYEEYLNNESKFLDGIIMHVFPMYGLEFSQSFTIDQYREQRNRKDGWWVDITNWNRVLEYKNT